MARSGGFEPPTAWFVARYSIQLSYERAKLSHIKLAVREGFEPSVRVNAHTLSRRAPSATRTPHQFALGLLLPRERGVLYISSAPKAKKIYTYKNHHFQNLIPTGCTYFNLSRRNNLASPHSNKREGIKALIRGNALLPLAKRIMECE